MATSKTQPNEKVGVESESIDSTGDVAVGWRYSLKKVKQDTTARLGLYVIAVMTAMAVVVSIDYYLLDYYIAETFWYHPAKDPDQINQLQPPAFTSEGSWSHPLGTDSRGRDVLARLIYGSRISMTVGLAATFLGLVGGTIVGSVAGYYGGWVDDILMRIVETIYSIPFLVLIIAFMAAIGTRDVMYATIGVGIAIIPVFARLIRSRVLSVREEEYVEAARAAGVKDRKIIVRHIIPNSFAPVMVQATLQIGICILIVAGLSFLGYGAQPPTPDWGQMLASSRNFMIPNPWLSIWPGLAILITVMGFNLLGDGLQDALDPRSR
ncbi:ABC transporter permease [Natronosalvus halobius]|uniref:ABC transporter permease n=1 Tax=Natronosalvus halobius TaxID=2953746 RepID=UPI00209CD5DC|nr:ABC transporter permease [Natronosalvus halobius]USZ73685.1 ABC transporter permease [Natronosalvus halobius]